MKNFKSDHIYRKIYSLEITQSIYKPDSFFVESGNNPGGKTQPKEKSRWFTLLVE